MQCQMFRFNELEHKSNECPQRKLTNIVEENHENDFVDYEEEKEEIVDEDEGEELNCIV